MQRTSIIVTFQLEGLHNFPAAGERFPDVEFLASIHRHQFHFKLERMVYHDDRDVEFIMFKRDVIEYITDKYFSSVYNCLYFGAMSCEMIAIELANIFGLKSAEVWEDLENGARVENE